MTKCSRCRRTLRYAEHFLDTDRGYRYQADGDDPRYRKCQKCREEAAIARLEQSDGVKKERLVSLKQWKNKHPEKVQAQNKRYNDKLRIRVLVDSYGGLCVCCGENLLRLLTLGHVEEDGVEHRAQIGAGGLNILLWAVRHGFPDTLQCECFNCNIGRKLNGGICPHQEAVQKGLSQLAHDEMRKLSLEDRRAERH